MKSIKNAATKKSAKKPAPKAKASKPKAQKRTYETKKGLEEVAAALTGCREAYPAAYDLVLDVVAALDGADIDPESGLAAPAAALAKALVKVTFD